MSRMIRGEITKDLNIAELQALQSMVGSMPPDELKNYRNAFDPDEMGFYEKEAIDENAD